MAPTGVCLGAEVAERHINFDSQRPEDLHDVPVGVPLLASRLSNYAGKQIHLGARPEHVKVFKSSAQNATQTMALLERIETLGAQTDLHLAIGGCHCIARVASSEGLRVQEKVWVGMDTRQLHFFDQASGERIET